MLLFSLAAAQGDLGGSIQDTGKGIGIREEELIGVVEGDTSHCGTFYVGHSYTVHMGGDDLTRKRQDGETKDPKCYCLTPFDVFFFL